MKIMKLLLIVTNKDGMNDYRLISVNLPKLYQGVLPKPGKAF